MSDFPDCSEPKRDVRRCVIFLPRTPFEVIRHRASPEAGRDECDGNCIMYSLSPLRLGIVFKFCHVWALCMLKKLMGIVEQSIALDLMGSLIWPVLEERAREL